MRTLICVFLAVALSSSAFSALASARTVKITMDSKKPDGRAWDVMGGAPDPYIKVDGNSYRAQRCEDSYTCTIQIKEKGPITIEVWDADASNDDPAGATPCDTGMLCTTSGASVMVTD